MTTWVKGKGDFCHEAFHRRSLAQYTLSALLCTNQEMDEGAVTSLGKGKDMRILFRISFIYSKQDVEGTSCLLYMKEILFGGERGEDGSSLLLLLVLSCLFLSDGMLLLC